MDYASSAPLRKPSRLVLAARFTLITLAALTLCNTASQAQDAPKRRFGAGFVADSADAYAARPATVVTRAAQPSEVDLGRYFPPPGDQGQQSSCVAWSTAYARSYYEAVLNNADTSRPANVVSPAYIYNATHPGARQCEEGTIFQRAFSVLQNGAASLQDFPYDQRSCSTPPPDPASSGGDRFRIDSRILVIRGKSPIDRENAVKQALAGGQPVLFGMQIDERFEQLEKSRTPDRAARCERNFEYAEPPANGSGHAMVIVGFSNARQAFKVLNSWGKNWGCDGFVWISYATITGQVREFYILNTPNASKDRLQEVAKSVSRWGDPQSEDNVRKTVEDKTATGGTVTPVANTRTDAAQKQLDALLAGSMRNAGCALLAGRVDAQQNARVAGILPSSLALRQLKGGLGEMQSIQRVDMSLVKVRPWPQCEAMIAMLPVLDADNGVRLSVGGQRETSLHAGEVLRLEAVSPDQPAYVYMVYLQVGGEAVPVYKSARPLEPKSRIVYPPADAKTVPRVAAPFGDEMAIALASSERLPELENIGQATDREFLTVLDQALRNAQRRGKLRLSAAVAPVRTVER